MLCRNAKSSGCCTLRRVESGGRFLLLNYVSVRARCPAVERDLTRGVGAHPGSGAAMSDSVQHRESARGSVGEHASRRTPDALLRRLSSQVPHIDGPPDSHVSRASQTVA